MRIVSLLPSATEIICELGLGPQLVGVSHECDYPPEVLRIPKVTSSVIPKDAPSAEIDRLVRAHLQTSRALYMLDLDLTRLAYRPLYPGKGVYQYCISGAGPYLKINPGIASIIELALTTGVFHSS